MTLHLRSKDKLDIMSKESADSALSMQSVELPKQQQQQLEQQQHQKRLQHHAKSSSPSISFIAFLLIAAAMILSPTQSRNRSLLETNKNTSSLRTKPQQQHHHSVANVVYSNSNNNNNQKVQIIPQEPTVMTAEEEESKPIQTRTTKPTILIHIGPPKTGTTTLQCHLGLNFASMVKEQNFYYLGTWYAPLCGLPLEHSIPGLENAPRPILLDCYAPHIHKECNLDEQWRKFGDLFQRHYDKGHNLIVSDEMFHHHFQQDDVRRLGSILANWNVKIIYTYRHYYSSVPSMYHQLNDPYATGKGMANAVEKTIWPKDGGYRIESFRDSSSDTLDMERGMKRFSYWVEEFGTVHVFNMESSTKGSGGGDYLSSFLCTMMPELKPSGCSNNNDESSTTTKKTASASTNSARRRNDNGSAKKFLHYDMLAVAAKDAGLLDSNTSLERTQVRDAIQQHCEENGWNDLSNFALDCLDDTEMETFLQTSLDQAKMMRQYFEQQQPPTTTPFLDDSSWTLLESEINTGFRQHAKRNQFCSIDTEASLQEERWKSFFNNLVTQEGAATTTS